MVDGVNGAGTPGDPTGGEAPLVVACLAPADLRPEVDPLSGEVHVDLRRPELTASDAAALEHALRAGEAWGGRVLAVTAGPASIDRVLRQVAAVGAEVLRIPWPPGMGHAADANGTATTDAPEDGIGRPVPVDGPALAADPNPLAIALAAAISSAGRPALVVCGDRSTLGGTGAVPALLAHHLGAAQALGLVSMQVDIEGHGAGRAVIAERRLDGGWRQRLRVTPPSVCSVEAAGVRLRRAPLSAALAAAGMPVPVMPAPAGAAAAAAGALRIGAPRPYRPRTCLVAAPSGDTQQRLLALTGALATHDPPRLVGPVDAPAAARELLDYLARHGYWQPAVP